MSDMRCENVRRQIAAYRELGPAAQREVQGHLASCPDCTRVWEAYRVQDRVLASLPRLTPSPGLRAAVLAQTTRRNLGMPRSLVRRLASTAMMIILALAVSFAGTIGAAAQALPGDLLYPVKRAAEKVRLTMTLSQAARQRYLEQLAEERLAEVLQVQAEGRSVEVDFIGRLEAVIDGTWIVEGIEIRNATDALGTTPPPIGSIVAFEAKVEQGQVKASRAVVKEPPAMPRTATATPTATPPMSQPSPTPPIASITRTELPKKSTATSRTPDDLPGAVRTARSDETEQTPRPMTTRPQDTNARPTVTAATRIYPTESASLAVGVVRTAIATLRPTVTRRIPTQALPTARIEPTREPRRERTRPVESTPHIEPTAPPATQAPPPVPTREPTQSMPEPTQAPASPPVLPTDRPTTAPTARPSPPTPRPTEPPADTPVPTTAVPHPTPRPTQPPITLPTAVRRRDTPLATKLPPALPTALPTRASPTRVAVPTTMPTREPTEAETELTPPPQPTREPPATATPVVVSTEVVRPTQNATSVANPTRPAATPTSPPESNTPPDQRGD